MDENSLPVQISTTEGSEPILYLKFFKDNNNMLL